MVEMSVETASVYWKVCQWLSSWQSVRVNWVKALSIKSSCNTQFNSYWRHYASISMLKHIEFFKHFRVLIPLHLLKNRKTGQCTRWINSSENKTYSAPKTPFNEVPHVGKIDELLTVVLLSIHWVHRVPIWFPTILSGRWGQCHQNNK